MKTRRRANIQQAKQKKTDKLSNNLLQLDSRSRNILDIMQLQNFKQGNAKTRLSVAPLPKLSQKRAS